MATTWKNRLYVCLYLTWVLLTVICLYSKQTTGNLTFWLPSYYQIIKFLLHEYHISESLLHHRRGVWYETEDTEHAIVYIFRWNFNVFTCVFSNCTFSPESECKLQMFTPEWLSLGEILVSVLTSHQLLLHFIKRKNNSLAFTLRNNKCRAYWNHLDTSLISFQGDIEWLLFLFLKIKYTSNLSCRIFLHTCLVVVSLSCWHRSGDWGRGMKEKGVLFNDRSPKWVSASPKASSVCRMKRFRNMWNRLLV
jgi:hypothetical protein